MKKYDIVSLGETLIDYTPMPDSPLGMKVFEQNAGGAVANATAAATKLGLNCAFLGKVGNDMQGDFLISTLKKIGVDVSGTIKDDKYFTTLAFVALSDKGERSFSFARKPGADTQITKDELDLSVIDSGKIFHFGSLSLTDNPSREATIYAMKYAKQKELIISYDPNYRSALWESEQMAVEQMRSVLSYIDIIKISDEETELLTDKKSPEDAANKLIDMGIKIAVVTLGKNGALVATKEGNAVVPAPYGSVVDTTGAGDSFWGAFLYKIIRGGTINVDINTLKEYIVFGNVAATICVGRRGAIPALPTLDEVKKWLSNLI